MVTKRLAANKMDGEMGNNYFSYYLSSLNFTLYLSFSSCFQITF